MNNYDLNYNGGNKMNNNKAVLEVKFKGLGAVMILIAGMSWLAGAWSGYLAGKDKAEDEEAQQ